LSARIVDGKDGPEYLFDELQAIPLETMDVSGLPTEAVVEEARRLASEQVWKPFECASGPWVRSFLIRLGDMDYVFGMVVHHLLADAVSMGIARTELMQAYRLYAMGQRPAAREKESLQYADWSVAMNEWVQSGAGETHARYWRGLLRGAPATRIRPDRELDLDEYSDVALHSFHVPSGLVAQLRRLGERKRCFFQAIIAAGLIATIASVTKSTDVVVASQITGRHDSNVMGMIGPLFDAFAIRVNVALTAGFEELLEAVQRQLIDSLPHQAYPFEMVKAALRGIGASDAFPMFNLLDLSDQRAEEDRGTGIAQHFDLLQHPLEIQSRRIHTSFYLRLLVREDGINAQIVYLASMYQAHTISAFAETFCRVLQEAVAHPGRKLPSPAGEREVSHGTAKR